jgi:hypothetical protein
MTIKWLTALASAATIGFGVWHLFVPRQWNWYSYMDPAATELVLAVRAINFFFSFSLILLGVINLLIVFGETKSTYPLVVVLGASSLLWLARVVMQLLYPQGTITPMLQYGMLAGFVVVFLLYAIATFLVWRCGYCTS